MNSEVMRRLARSGRVGHGYLFTGNGDLVKEALSFAAELLGAESTHPDLHLLKPTGKAGVHTIEAIRNFCRDVYLAPYEPRPKGRGVYLGGVSTSPKFGSELPVPEGPGFGSLDQGPRKIFIIAQADRMQVEAANALLKTLEEPALDTVLILVTAFPEGLLPTLFSRCQKVTFAGESALLASDPLLLKLLAPETQSNYALLSTVIAELHEQIEQEQKAFETAPKEDEPCPKGRGVYLGRVSTPPKFGSELPGPKGPGFGSLDEEFTPFQKAAALKEREGAAALQFTARCEALFRQILTWYRDLHLLRAQGDARHLFHSIQLPELQRQAALSMPPLENVQMHIADAQTALARFLPLQASLEALFLKIHRDRVSV